MANGFNGSLDLGLAFGTGIGAHDPRRLFRDVPYFQNTFSAYLPERRPVAVIRKARDSKITPQSLTVSPWVWYCGSICETIVSSMLLFVARDLKVCFMHTSSPPNRYPVTMMLESLTSRRGAGTVPVKAMPPGFMLSSAWTFWA